MYEANIVEQEASAPLLEKIIEENNIKGVLFDLDNTLLYTNEYFITTEEQLSMELAEMFQSSIPTEVFAQRMASNMNQAWIKIGYRPKLEQERYLSELDNYFRGTEPPRYGEYRKFVIDYLENFYDTCPDIIEGSIEVLRLIREMGLCFALNSHAQDKWTKIKAMKFAEEMNMHAIAYNAVPIDHNKDCYSWCKTARYIGIGIEEALVIGDGLETDILPAIEAGCRNLVWIKGDLEKLPIEIKDNPDIHIWCVDSVKELL